VNILCAWLRPLICYSASWQGLVLFEVVCAEGINSAGDILIPEIIRYQWYVCWVGCITAIVGSINYNLSNWRLLPDRSIKDSPRLLLFNITSTVNVLRGKEGTKINKGIVFVIGQLQLVAIIARSHSFTIESNNKCEHHFKKPKNQKPSKTNGLQLSMMVTIILELVWTADEAYVICQCPFPIIQPHHSKKQKFP
jgi:hypothetical protein